MDERRQLLRERSMFYGTLLGVYLCIKFIFVPLGLTKPVFGYLFLACTFSVPVVSAVLGIRFRIRDFGGSMTFGEGFSFSMRMYMYALLLAAACHFVYFQFIDNGMLFNSMIDSVEALKQIGGNMSEAAGEMEQNVDMIRSAAPINIVVSLLIQNMFFALILAPVNALLIMKKKRN